MYQEQPAAARSSRLEPCSRSSQGQPCTRISQEQPCTRSLFQEMPGAAMQQQPCARSSQEQPCTRVSQEPCTWSSQEPCTRSSQEQPCTRVSHGGHGSVMHAAHEQPGAVGCSHAPRTPATARRGQAPGELGRTVVASSRQTQVESLGSQKVSAAGHHECQEQPSAAHEEMEESYEQAQKQPEVVGSSALIPGTSRGSGNF